LYLLDQGLDKNFGVEQSKQQSSEIKIIEQNVKPGYDGLGR